MLKRFIEFMTKPRSLKPEYRVVGKELLDLLADLKKRVEDMEKRLPVLTQHEGDHQKISHVEHAIDEIRDSMKFLHLEEMTHFQNSLIDFADQLRIFVKRIERLEENDRISNLVRRTLSRNWQRPRRKDGRWTKRGDGNATA